MEKKMTLKIQKKTNTTLIPMMSQNSKMKKFKETPMNKTQITMKKLEDPMGPVKKPNQTMKNQITMNNQALTNRTDQLTQDMFVKETAMKNNVNVMGKSSTQKIN